MNFVIIQNKIQHTDLEPVFFCQKQKKVISKKFINFFNFFELNPLFKNTLGMFKKLNEIMLKILICV